MSAAASTADPSRIPDPHQDRTPTDAGPPRRALRFLCLVRKLIDYGMALASTLQQHAAGSNLPPIRLCFGTPDIALILQRIARALRLAAALEVVLVNRACRREPLPAPAGAPPRPPPRAAPPGDGRGRQPAAPLALVPTAEEIAAELRRRPAAAVLAQIFHDLGITCGHPLWPELSAVFAENGGRLLTLFRDVSRRVRLSVVHMLSGAPDGRRSEPPPPWVERWQPTPAGCGTGPP